MSKTVFISAGEASGDLHAANLVSAFRSIESSKGEANTRFVGMGSSKMQSAGVELLVDSSGLAVVGIFEVLMNYRKIKAALNTLCQHIKHSPPDLIILVDYQEFNHRLARFAKSHGVKTLFYIGPQVWAWRPGRVKKYHEYIDMMAVIFPFEVSFYKNAGIDVSYVGHPLIGEAKSDLSQEEARSQDGISNSPVIGLMPGSRSSELKRLLNTFARCAKLITGKYPDVQFVLPVANTLNKSEIAQTLEPYSVNVHYVESNHYDALMACDAVITASGTATLELALLGIPMTVVYRISPFTYYLVRPLVTIENIGLANIVAEKSIVREFIQGDAKPRKIVEEITRILEDEAYRSTMTSELNNVHHKLESGASDTIARLAHTMLNS